jgi:threonine dehydrogenase-like Zn-dependent dehydrogenase
VALQPGSPLDPAELARLRQLAADRVAVDPDDGLAQAVFLLADEVDRRAAAMADVLAWARETRAEREGQIRELDRWDRALHAALLIGLGVTIGGAVAMVAVAGS